MHAGSEVIFMFRKGIYIAPSDILLRVGHVTGCNNEIILAMEDQTLGLNNSISAAITPPDAANDKGQKGIVSQLRSHLL